MTKTSRYALSCRSRACITQVVRERFGEVVEEAAAGRLQHWRHGYEALASVIVRDQFTRF